MKIRNFSFNGKFFDHAARMLSVAFFTAGMLRIRFVITTNCLTNYWSLETVLQIASSFSFTPTAGDSHSRGESRVYRVTNHASC